MITHNQQLPTHIVLRLSDQILSYACNTPRVTMGAQPDRKQLSVRLAIRTIAELERESQQLGVSRSEYIRQIIDDRHRADALEQRLTVREDRIDELEQQLARRSQVEEKIENLPAQIQQQRSYQERRQRAWDQASVLQRMKWRVTGIPQEIIEAQKRE